MQKTRGISNAVLSIPESATHGTAAKLVTLNRELAEGDQIVDLSIGALDTPTDPRIDRGVVEFIQTQSGTVHAFAPVRGFPFLRESIAARVTRLHGIEYDPDTEVMVTPGGVKGSISVTFHALLDPGDEVVIPVPNWPHYADMVRLHEAIPKTVLVTARDGLTAPALEEAISERTKIVVLGDCINPTGKVYSTEELSALAHVVAQHNVRRESRGESPIYVLFDTPYEAHILGARAKTFAAIDVQLADGSHCSMRPWTVAVTGPGKTYGMHGDRIGYLCGPADIVDAAARAQVNITSFASTYGQIATNVALQPEMDAVATSRARDARTNLEVVLRELDAIPSLQIIPPQGGYFLFADLSRYADAYQKHGYATADQFLLAEARVATICGSHFAEGEPLDHFVRINCGRTRSLLSVAVARIRRALTGLES
ncbi:pyridoxal phosphate-dependent aminotransferase [Streptantibioticus ferralitis]|uniref:Aminotransferase class I/II-fold pyridoxal phosphate-dependent enzyme n=1 Tax=Streptantibioticus ferralitis TaxID=236510 RepID=A0ABT5Z543_9ACTN|nr:aminotransferase class I/II-fold pyridoxal phosphate-dependent enzyme [Streptantibioticus ferralitis]MDF2258957.1 aminotransferase class I/II-fold pyridoxal phosphate-dependent enzyme [Streptantibioticus ferralitis]